MRFSARLSIGVLGLLCVVACGSPDGGVEEEFVVINRQALEESCEGRSNPLLQSLKQDGGTVPAGGGPRACNYDEDCPQGSACNESTRMCDWSCLEAGPTGTACATGQVCNCSGRCVAEGSSEPLVLSQQLPRVDVTPAFVEFTTPTAGAAFQAQSLLVGLAVMDPGTLSSASTTPIRVVAGRDMEVSCHTSAGPTAYAAECALSAWTFNPFGTGYRAENQVDIRPRTGSTANAWHVTLEALARAGQQNGSATPQRTRVQAERAGTAPGASGGVRPFWGTVTLQLDGASDGGTEPVVLPVRAYGNSTYLMLQDDSRTLSPSGKVVLSTTQTSHAEEWLPSSTGSHTQDAVTVELVGSYDGGAAASNTLSGTFQLVLPRNGGGTWGVSGTYQLSRLRQENDAGVLADAPLTACPASPCQAGYSCETTLGVCVPGPRTWSSPGGTASSTIVHEERAAWDAEAQSKLTAFMSESASAGRPTAPWRLARGILCNQGNRENPPEIAGFPTYASAAAGVPHVMSYSGDLRCLNGQPPYLGDIATQWERYPDNNGLKNLERLTDQEMLAECLADLRRSPVNTSSGNGTDWFIERYGTKYPVLTGRTSVTQGRVTPGRCLNLARLYGALHLSTRENNSRDQRLAWRLLQQWLAVHSYVSRQVAQQRELANFLNETTGTLPELPDALTRFEGAWDLLLDGAYAGLMPGNDATRTCSLLNPDYRLPPPPVASWAHNTSSQSVQDRGGTSRWKRNNVTFFFHNPNVWSACTNSTTATQLFSASYQVDEVPLTTAARSLQGSCLNKGTYVEVTVQAARKTATNGTALSIWTLNVPSGVSPVRFAVLDRGTSLSLFNSAKAHVAPSPRTLTFEHFSLRAPYVQTVNAPAGSRLAVWDFLVDDAMLSEAIDNPTLYDTPSGDLGTLPNPKSHHEQAVGLPVTILEGLAAHLRLLNLELENVERTTLASCQPASPNTPRDQALARFGRTLRYVLTMESLARSAYARERAGCAQANGVELPWDKRWQSAQAELASVRRQSYEKVRAINNCHPYGMPENEAPLYFASVATDPIQRYFGSSTYLHGEAWKLMERAKVARDAARSAWEGLRVSEVQEALNDDAKAQRIRDLKRQYGAPIITMCGLTDVTAEDVFDRFDPVKSPQRFGLPALRPESCFIKPDTTCQAPVEQIHDLVNNEHARFTLCTWRKLVSGPEVYTDSNVQALVTHYGSATVSGRVVSVTGGSLPVSRLYELPLRLDQIPSGALTEAHEACVRERGALGSQLPTAANLGFKRDNSCYRGELGTAMLGIVSAQQSLQVAQSQWGEFQEKFDIAQKRCMQMDEAAAKQTELADQYEKSMGDLIRQKGKVDRRINNVSDINNKAEGIVGGLVTSIATGNVVGAIWGGIKLFGGVAENRLKDKAIRIGENMQRLELQHKAEIERLQLAAAVQQCYTEAQMHLVGVGTAALQIDRVDTEVDAALMTMENLEGRVRQLLYESAQVVAQEEARQVPHFAHDFWVGEKITAARDSFYNAKRMAFLFGKALEYEKQASYSALSTVLSAPGPDQLQAALEDYTFSEIDKTVNGAFPNSRPLVLQLREQALKLTNRLTVPEGERALTMGERFTRRLLSPDSAVYDDNGVYLGQGLRFTIPKGLWTNRCAERIWTVHVHLRGDDQLSTWLTTKGNANLLLRKRNTFGSHICAPTSDTNIWQVMAVRPSLRSGYPGTTRPGEETSFALASVGAQTGQTTDQFQNTPMGSGSVELQGRGLYGEYEILFPWHGLMSVSGTPTGFPLDGVTDVMVRFDEVSVATSVIYKE